MNTVVNDNDGAISPKLRRNAQRSTVDSEDIYLIVDADSSGADNYVDDESMGPADAVSCCTNKHKIAFSNLLHVAAKQKQNNKAKRKRGGGGTI